LSQEKILIEFIFKNNVDSEILIIFMDQNQWKSIDRIVAISE
jgi:hypothetical protein